MWQYIKNIYHHFIAVIASMYYGFPGSKIRVIGITGTDGKTTTTHLIHHILQSSGKKSSMVSSVYAEIANKIYDTGFHVTTPDSFMLQKFLKQAVDGGSEYMVLEVTSHGLDQNRVSGINFNIGVLTNVTHEHLDYHKTYDRYLRAKEKLLKYASTAIINGDDESYQYFDKRQFHKIRTYGIKKSADITPHTFPFTSPLPGEYNRYNCLAAITTCRELGIEDDSIRKALETFPGVKGRYEKFPTHKNFEVVIDFAHTPNAIEKVLSAAKPKTKNKLIHVFGSAAKRDYLKRPVMGKMSAQFSDYIILTEEDYRDEDVNVIINEIATGAFKQGAVELQLHEYKKALSSKKPVVFRIPDRQTAINFAIQKLAKKGDMVILTGKAHEKSICRGRVEYPWSEHEAINNALQKNTN